MLASSKFGLRTTDGIKMVFMGSCVRFSFPCLCWGDQWMPKAEVLFKMEVNESVLALISRGPSSWGANKRLHCFQEALWEQQPTSFAGQLRIKDFAVTCCSQLRAVVR